VVEHQGHALSITGMVTPLHLETKEGHVDVACFILDQGADADASERDNENCIGRRKRDNSK
jgi:hypothetical protein